jgi:AraC-like DNA-binding protein
LGPCADWSRVEGALDLLTVRSAPSKAWRFVWPGRVVVQAMGTGVTWRHLDRHGELRPGAVLVLDAFAAQTRLATTSGASLRVAFELDAREGVSSRFPARPPYAGPELDMALSPTKLFFDAVEIAGQPLPFVGRLTGPVARARRYIEENLAEEFDLEALGASAGVDRCHLCRVFQRAIGLPPYRFRAHLRVARARALLASGLDCTQVAFAVGFCDQSHLIRCFKELTGTTPGAYARACRAPATESRPSAA